MGTQVERPISNGGWWKMASPRVVGIDYRAGEWPKMMSVVENGRWCCWEVAVWEQCSFTLRQ